MIPRKWRFAQLFFIFFGSVFFFGGKETLNETPNDILKKPYHESLNETLKEP